MVGAIVLCFGAWLYANNAIEKVYKQLLEKSDTVAFSSASSSGGLDPLYLTNSIFNDDFETTKSWTYINSDVNKWYTGSAVNNGGTKSLYISDDNGITNNYSASLNNEDVSLAISSSFDIPLGAKDYIVSFDYRCNGEGSVIGIRDALSVWLIPDSFSPPKNLRINNTSGGLLIKEDLYNQKFFKKEIVKVDLSKFSGTKMKIVFQWHSNMWTFNQPPLLLIMLMFLRILVQHLLV